MLTTAIINVSIHMQGKFETGNSSQELFKDNEWANSDYDDVQLPNNPYVSFTIGFICTVLKGI